MKPTLLIFLLLCIHTANAQKKYTVDGELQFIHEDEIVILRGGEHYILALDPGFGNKEFAFNESIRLMTREQFNDYARDTNNISPKDIDGRALKTLDRNYFTDVPANPEQQNQFTFYRYNEAFFSLKSWSPFDNRAYFEDIQPYIVIDFGRGKKIWQFYDGDLQYVIPTAQKMLFVFRDSNLTEAFKKYTTAPLKKLSPADLHFGNNGTISLDSDYYRVDALPTGKVTIYDRMNDRLAIDQAFDSIVYNGDFIIGYTGSRPGVYNYQFKKSALRNIRAVHFVKYVPRLQAIQGNTIISINLAGNYYKRGDGPESIDLSHHFPDTYASVKVTKEGAKYIFTGDDFIAGVLPGVNFMNSSVSMYHTAAYDSIQFMGNSQYITLSTEGGYKKKLPILIYARLKNGKYDLNTLEYLLTEHPDTAMAAYNSALPKNLDSIAAYGNDDYFIEKDGLFTWYPIMKEIRYKKLSAFDGYYARYELPDGKKGFLAKDGKEYPDE